MERRPRTGSDVAVTPSANPTYGPVWPNSDARSQDIRSIRGSGAHDMTEQAASLRFIDATERSLTRTARHSPARTVDHRAAGARAVAVGACQHLPRLPGELHLHHDPAVGGPQHRQGILRAGDGRARGALRHRRLHRGRHVGQLRDAVLGVAPHRGNGDPARGGGGRHSLVPARRRLSGTGDARARGVGAPSSSAPPSISAPPTGSAASPPRASATSASTPTRSTTTS